MKAGVAQLTTSPQFPRADEPVTFTFDVSGTSFAGYTGEVWVWTWIEEGCLSVCDAPTNVNPATTAQNAARAIRSATNADVYSITFTPTEFFGKPASEFKRLGLLLKGRDWSNGQTKDYVIQLSEGGFEVAFTAPSEFPLFLNAGESLTISATASELAELSLQINGIEVTSTAGNNTLDYTATAGSSGKHRVVITANNGTETVEDSFSFVVRSETITEARPAGVIPGINYSADPSQVTLALLAPGKSTVYVVGEFTNWEVGPAFQMKKDGNLFWLTIDNLTAGKEYPFQYLVDETIYIADPFADKILDPDDQYISGNSYPGLINYPAEALHEQWYFNRLSILETGRTGYQWQTTAYSPPPKEELVIYELLIRDFFGENEQNYQNLTDTLSYLKDLGVNAIELMPVMEFNGNESWGYNPTFMFAPDKFYGTRNKLKEFIDKAHGQGIAVILDIAMNHNDIPAPYAMMYFDFNSMKPALNNPWFNTDATHPFNVFFDYNHESTYTQAFLDTINHYWINEYNVDGFRFDLSKGFTQNNSGDDVGLWSNYDASRIAILKRMADAIWSYSPETYVILEHFAANREEKELADYGMLLWGNLNHAYNQSTMGYSEGAVISGGYYGSRGWTSPHLITYMESHDEERIMFKNLTYGNGAGDYDVTDLQTALDRTKAAAAFFYTIPGPKMLWQFGELGYDQSINRCPDGSINSNCRVAPKPVPWNESDGLDHYNDPKRKELLALTKELTHLRNEYRVFHENGASFIENELVKQLSLLSGVEKPASPDEMNVVVVGNFDVVRRTVTVTYPHAGNWYNYFNPAEILSAATPEISVALNPGEFRMYTDVKLPDPPRELLVTAVRDDIQNSAQKGRYTIYPNPASAFLTISGIEDKAMLHILTPSGKRLISQELSQKRNTVAITALPPGIYLVKIDHYSLTTTTKLIKIE